MRFQNVGWIKHGSDPKYMDFVVTNIANEKGLTNTVGIDDYLIHISSWLTVIRARMHLFGTYWTTIVSRSPIVKFQMVIN
jgi:hypothetical protein